MIRILRPGRKTSFISAEVFEQLFLNHLGHLFDIQREPLIAWCNNILGTSEAPYSFHQAAQNFYRYTKGFDYFCPGYECIPLSPLFMTLRNSSRANIRLLFIAHAPGASVLEWVLLKPLLVPGDMVIAPSKNAKEVIELLCPEILSFVRVIPHPMEKLPTSLTVPENTNEKRLVTLSRICETKLTHRQIEAMVILQKRGYKNLRMDIAGSLNVNDDPSKEITQYVRSLQVKIARLELENAVRLVGPVYGGHHKAKFLAGAKALLNLSVTPEESFGKAIIEALSLGIPVVATQWDGFVETVGNAGKLIPLIEVADGVMDVDVKDVADAIEELLNAPPSAETCVAQAKKFVPNVICEQYRIALQEGIKYQPSEEIKTDPFSEYDGGAAESQGLLGKIAVLQYFSWKELLANLVEFSKKIRQTWEEKEIKEIYTGEIVQNLLFISTKTPIEYFYAGKDYQKWTRTSEQVTKQEHRVQGHSLIELRDQEYKNLNFAEKIAKGVQTHSIPSSKEACLLSLSKGNQVDLLEESLAFLEENGESCTEKNHYHIELEYLKGNYSTAYQLFTRHHPVSSIKEHEVHLLRQIARICRKWENPEFALPWLREWLYAYPDSPQSGAAWLDFAMNASSAQGRYFPEAREALKKAKELLGNLPVVKKLEHNMFLKTISTIW